MSEVLDALKDEHFRLVSPEEALEGKRFCVDCLCHDVLMFSPECANDLVKNHLVTAGKLVLQVVSPNQCFFNDNLLVNSD